MATSEAKEIKKQETLVRFSIISYKTRLRVCPQKKIKYRPGFRLKFQMSLQVVDLHGCGGCLADNKLCGRIFHI